MSSTDWVIRFCAVSFWSFNTVINHPGLLQTNDADLLNSRWCRVDTGNKAFSIYWYNYFKLLT